MKVKQRRYVSEMLQSQNQQDTATAWHIENKEAKRDNDKSRLPYLNSRE